MRNLTWAGLATVLWIGPAIADEDRRELDAHEHGHGALNIAIEGGSVWMELEVPGADIVGFEHAAVSDDDKASVEVARSVLARPLDIMVFPDAAGCAVESSQVAIVGDEADDHAAEDEHNQHDEHGAAGEANHNEFHAEYALSCSDPEKISSIDFAYFDQFPAAEELTVSLITDKGQSAHAIDRDSRNLDLGGLI